MSIEDHPALLREAFERAIEAAAPAACLPPHLPGRGEGRTYLIAAGKAAAAMAEVAAKHLAINKALVVFPHGHGPATRLPLGFKIICAGHPVPDTGSLSAADQALEMAHELGSGDRLIVLISGGASALLAAPAPGITISDKQELTRALLASGAPIGEINCVRQCLSRIKGGRLAKAAGEADVLTYAISDVAGDRPEVIASGPTLPSSATLARARAILRWRGVDAPPAIHEALRNSRNAPINHLRNAQAKVVARSADALRAAADYLSGAGFTPLILGDAIEGEARSLAAADAHRAMFHINGDEKVALIAGGEGAVRVPKAPPRGGRNLEYGLALAVVLKGHPRISALSCDSDGIDGSSPAAGALVGPQTLAAIASAGIDPVASLERHDSYRALAAADAVVTTGPTRTNVNDIRILLVEP